MTVIRPNSVSGINSITAQADEIKVFKSNGTQGGLIIGGANLNATTGISTLLALNVTGNVSIAGTLTYQDVTNVDSIGIITARAGVNVSAGQLDVGSNIKLGNAGVITATSFSGSGANLTGISAGTALSGSTNNTVCTVTGANAIQGEANLTFTGSQLNVTGNISLPDSTAPDYVGNIYVGNNSDLKIFHNGSTNFIRSGAGGHTINIDNNSGVVGAKFIPAGAVELYHNGSKKFETSSVGVTISGNAYFANDRAVIFGTGNDAAIYHNDTDFVIDAQDSGATRNIYINAGTVNEGGIYLRSAAGDTMFKALTDANCFLYYDNSLKLRTMTDGIENRGHSYPVSNNTYDLGTSSLRWRNIYTNDLNLSNEGSTNSVDNTWGNYTIQEGESDLFLINNRNGKKYKFNLTEVS